MFPFNVECIDIDRGLPVAAGAADAIYCSHVLEHPAFADFRRALTNTHRASRGGFRLEVPDLEGVARDYVAARDAGTAVRSMEGTRLGQRERPRDVCGVPRAWFGSSFHVRMWDYNALAAKLERAGFTPVCRAQLGHALEPAFRDAEDSGRGAGSVGVECITE